MVPGGGGAEHWTYSTKPGIFARDQLYDLEADPGENHNLANDPRYQAVLRELKEEFGRYIDELARAGARGQIPGPKALV